MQTAANEFINIEARTAEEAGAMKGEKLKDVLQRNLEKEKQKPRWKARVASGLRYRKSTQEHFPHYLREADAQAKRAEMDPDEAWAVLLEDEGETIDPKKDGIKSSQSGDRCTTIIANGGNLIGHREDWEPEMAACD